MQDFIKLILDYINVESTSTFVLALATLALVYFTYSLAEEAKKTREFQKQIYQPKLSVIFKQSPRWVHFLYLEIENIGKSPLYNLKLIKIENDFIFDGLNKKTKIKDIKYIKRIIYLKPQQKISQFFASGLSNKNLFDQKFSLEFSYENENSELLHDKFNFDFSHFEDTTKLGKHSLEEISEELKKINNTINSNKEGKEIGGDPIKHGIKTRNNYINKLNLEEIKNLLNNLKVSDCDNNYNCIDDTRDILMVYRNKLLIKKELSHAEKDLLSNLNDAYKQNFYIIDINQSKNEFKKIINKIIKNGENLV